MLIKGTTRDWIPPPADYCRLNSSSGYVPYVGGNYNTNTNYGVFDFDVNNGPSNTNSNIGSRLGTLTESNNPYIRMKIIS